MNELKYQSYLCFYDFVIDKKAQFATKVLKDPFCDVSKLEKIADAADNWKKLGD